MTKKRLISRTKHGITYLFVVMMYFLLAPLSFLLYRPEKMWLVAEVDYDARDNGFIFFKYVRKSMPNQKIIYVLSKKNRNYDLVSKLGNTVEPHSFKHFLLFIGAINKISTIVNGCCPSYYLKKFLKKHKAFGRQINLKHGIYKDFSPMDLKKNAKCDLIFCGGYPEYEYILSTYGYSEKEVKYTGLARFDELYSCLPKKQILIMPTWRRWLNDISPQEFLNSDFCKQWTELLSSHIIKEISEDYQILFFCHPKMNNYLFAFKTIPDYVTLCNSHDHHLPDLIKDSMVLITDYSSVFFDFAYMKRCTLYYQFDENQFYLNHYKKTYFDYKLNGFGPVAKDMNTLIKILDDYAKRSFLIQDEYKKRSEEFFKLFDNKNCYRILKDILLLDGKNKN